MTRVLFDANVILDILGGREPFADDSGAALGRAEAGAVEAFVAAHTITTLHYLLSRHLSRARTRRALTDLMTVVEVAPVDADRIRHALALDWQDFEDGVQAACAEAVSADYIVTRDKRGFRKSAVPPVTPSELLALTPG